MDDLYGWRARVGLIYMASSWVMEPEFQAMAPPGVTVHTTRISFTKATVEGVGLMAGSAEVEQCTGLLATAPLHVICFGGMSASFVHGRGWDVSMRERMAKVSRGIPVTTTATASLAALRAVGARRVVFAGPYIPEVTERGRRFFEANGFAVPTPSASASRRITSWAACRSRTCTGSRARPIGPTPTRST